MTPVGIEQDPRTSLALENDCQRCDYCDGTGDVHDRTGEWRGTCICVDGLIAKLQSLKVVLGHGLA